MITASERDHLKKIIGWRHIAQVNKYLIDQGVTNRDGGYYSNTYISTVFNGHEKNTEVEERIWELAEIKTKAAEELEARKKDILGKHEELSADQQKESTLNL